MTESRGAMTHTRRALLVPLALCFAVLIAPSGAVYQFPGATAAQRAALCGPSGCEGGVVVRGPAGRQSPIGAVAALGLGFVGFASSSAGVGLGRRRLWTYLICLGIAMLYVTTTGAEMSALAERLNPHGRFDEEIAPIWHRGAALGLILYGVVLGAAGECSWDSDRASS